MQSVRWWLSAWCRGQMQRIFDVRQDIPVWVKKSTPPENNTRWNISFQITKSGAGLQLLPLDGRAQLQTPSGSRWGKLPSWGAWLKQNLILRGGILMSIGNLPESLSQATFSRDNVTREIGLGLSWVSFMEGAAALQTEAKHSSSNDNKKKAHVCVCIYIYIYIYIMLCVVYIYIYIERERCVCIHIYIYI